MTDPEGFPALNLAVIGAGVSGCALAAELVRRGWTGPLTLWEMGRGPGGRAATRRSRLDPARRVDHGAPLFNISGQPAPRLLAPLRQGGWIEPWTGGTAGLDGTGRPGPHPDDPLLEGDLYRGVGGMDGLCRGLLELAGARVRLQAGTLVRELDVTPGGRWVLLDGAGERLAEVDWLVLSGSLLAHPRALSLFGWPGVPLRQVATTLADPALDAALAAIGAMPMEPRTTLLLVLDPETARPWRSLPFRLLGFDAAAQRRYGLIRVVIQPLEEGRCAVVAHASAERSAWHSGVVGSGSVAAGLLGAPDPAAETGLIEDLTEALRQAMAPWFAAPFPLSGSPPQLMRWGAAFPGTPGLPEALSCCPRSRIGFCGDGIAGPGFGRIEGALRSAEGLAARLVALLHTAPAPDR